MTIYSMFIPVIRYRCNQSPILDIENNGKITSGSLTLLIAAVKDGEDIRIVSDGSYSFPADNLEYDTAESMVGAMAIWSVSMKTKTVGRTKINSFQVMPRTPDPEVGGSSPTRVKTCCVLEKGSFTPHKYW